jgi:hypothetical protein
MSRTEMVILDPVAYAEAMEAHVRKETQEMALWSKREEIDMLIAQLQPLPRPPRALPWLIAPALALAFAAGVWAGGWLL